MLVPGPPKDARSVAARITGYHLGWTDLHLFLNRGLLCANHLPADRCEAGAAVRLGNLRALRRISGVHGRAGCSPDIRVDWGRGRCTLDGSGDDYVREH